MISSLLSFCMHILLHKKSIQDFLLLSCATCDSKSYTRFKAKDFKLHLRIVVTFKMAGVSFPFLDNRWQHHLFPPPQFRYVSDSGGLFCIKLYKNVFFNLIFVIFNTDSIFLIFGKCKSKL